MRASLQYFGMCMLVSLCAIAALRSPAYAQRKAQVEITPIAGWFFAGTLSAVNGELELTNTGVYGGAIAVEVERGYQAEFQYSYAASEASFYPYTPYAPAVAQGKVADVSVHYFQIGGIRTLDRGKVQPFGLFSLGATWFHPTSTTQGVKVEDVWRFSIALGGGLKIWTSDKIAVRLQGRLLMPIYFAGTSVYFGTGGAGAAVSGGIPILQGDLSGGLTFAL